MSNKEVIQENTAIIEEMLRKAEKADEPGELSRNRLIHSGDEELPAPMVATALKSAGYTYIYNRKTGERSITNNNMLPTQLKKKNEDGSYVFTLSKPEFKPKRGTLKCMLHAEDPNRAHYDELGFPTCKKSNLVSPFQVSMHMQKRHKAEWAALQQEKKEKEDTVMKGILGKLVKQS